MYFVWATTIPEGIILSGHLDDATLNNYLDV